MSIEQARQRIDSAERTLELKKLAEMQAAVAVQALRIELDEAERAQAVASLDKREAALAVSQAYEDLRIEVETSANAAA